MLYTFKKYAAELGMSPDDARAAYVATHPVIHVTDGTGKTVQTSDEDAIVRRYETDERFIDRHTQLRLDCLAVALQAGPETRHDVAMCVAAARRLTTLEGVEPGRSTEHVIARFVGLKLD